MPKKFIEKYIPSQEYLENHKYIKLFGSLLLNKQLWKLNRYTTPKAVAVGVFCAFLPMPFQMVVAAALAIVCSANLPVSVALVWITNPLTIPPLFYFTYKVGVYILKLTPQPVTITLSSEWLTSQLGQIWQPLLFGSLVCGIFFSTISYYAIKISWKYSVAKKWKLRNHRTK